MNHSKFENQFHAEQLMNKGKYKEALEIVDNLEKKGVLKPELHFSILIFKAELFKNMGFGRDTIKYANKAYQLSQNLGKNFLSFDALFFKFWGFYMAEHLDKCIKTIEQIKKLFPSLKKDQSKEFIKRKAYFTFIKACDVALTKKNSELQALKFFKLGLEILETIGDKIGKVSILNTVGNFYQAIGDLDKATIFFEQSLNLSKKIGNNAFFAENLYLIANLCRLKGDLDKALEYANHSLKFEEITGKVKIDNFLIIGEIYRIKGDLDLALKNCEMGLNIASEIDFKYQIARCLWRLGQIKWMNGNLKEASENLEMCLKISQDYDFLTNEVNSLFHLVRVNIDLGFKKKAEKYLYDLDQFLLKHFVSTESQWHSQLYRIAKAYILKTSNRARYKGEAEILYKQIAEEKVLYFELTIFAIIELCDLLIRDMGETNDPTILTELEPYIEQLLDISKNQNSYRYLAETKLLQAKLSLIKSEIKNARRFFTQAQKLADEKGLKLLARKISYEHDKLLGQLDEWATLKKRNAPISDRVDLVSLDETVDLMLRKRGIKIPKLEAEQPILLTILSKDGELLLSKKFSADLIIDDTFFSEYMSSFNEFSRKVFSESFDRVKFGQYKVLMKAVNHYSICYMFHGQTYSAQQKLSHFSEIIKKNTNIKQRLENAMIKEEIVDIDESPLLKEIIFESFMSDPQLFRVSFKVYTGDEPFVFVSYAHVNKLEVYPIIDYLNKKGIKIWHDEGIPVSENWKTSIAQNIERCTIFLVFISPHIIDSEYVRKEISFALKKKKRFIGVYLKETELPAELEFEIADIQSLMKYLIPKSEFNNKLREVLQPLLIK